MVRLKFVFANHDGVHVEQEQEIKKSILDVKEDLSHHGLRVSPALAADRVAWPAPPRPLSFSCCFASSNGNSASALSR